MRFLLSTHQPGWLRHDASRSAGRDTSPAGGPLDVEHPDVVRAMTTVDQLTAGERREFLRTCCRYRQQRWRDGQA